MFLQRLAVLFLLFSVCMLGVFANKIFIKLFFAGCFTLAYFVRSSFLYKIINYIKVVFFCGALFKNIFINTNTVPCPVIPVIRTTIT